MIFQGGIELRNVGRMMLAVMDFHGLLVDVRLQGTMIIWQVRKYVRNSK